MSSSLPLAFAIVGLTLAACSSQADTTYRGEPLATLHGTVASTGGTSPPPVDAALVWSPMAIDKGSAGGLVYLTTSKVVATKVAVTGKFPSAFTMQILTPPPDAVSLPCFPGDPTRPARVAVASILALRQGADASNVQPSDIYGDAFDFEVVYTDSDLGREGCPTLITTISSLSRGYHLLQWVPPATRLTQQANYAACAQANGGSHATCGAVLPDADFAEAAGGLETPITLTLQAKPVALMPDFMTAVTCPKDSIAFPMTEVRRHGR